MSGPISAMPISASATRSPLTGSQWASVQRVIGSMIYLWSYHAWNWGRSKRHRAMGYLGHAVDPTITDRKTYRETRNIGWIDGVGRAVEKANKRGKELRP